MKNRIPSERDSLGVPMTPPEKPDRLIVCQGCDREFPWEDPEQNEHYCPTCVDRIVEEMHPLRLTIDVDGDGRVFMDPRFYGQPTKATTRYSHGRMVKAAEALALIFELFSDSLVAEDFRAALRETGSPMEGEPMLERARRLNR